MTIVNLNGYEIDTTEGHEYHKEHLNSHMFCDSSDPKQWFAEWIEEDGKRHHRFYQLHYNHEGDVLKKITSYDSIEHTKHIVKRKKGRESDCYWSKNMKDDDEYEMVEETDYRSPSSENHQTWWKKGDKEQPKTPIGTIPKRKKRWGLF